MQQGNLVLPQEQVIVHTHLSTLYCQATKVRHGMHHVTMETLQPQDGGYTVPHAMLAYLLGDDLRRMRATIKPTSLKIK